MESDQQSAVLYRLDGVGKTYRPSRWRWSKRKRCEGSVTALASVDLEVYRGEFLAVLGRSGEGKSTLLNLLGALDKPTVGTLSYEGRRVRRRHRVAFRRDHVGFVFQMFHLLPYKSALDNVALGLTVLGVSRREARAEARFWLDRLGLAGRTKHRPDQLSGGEKQRVAIARAMVKRPAVLLADEPTGNLDKESRREVLCAIRQMNRKHDTTVVLVTHNRADAEEYADRIVTLDGRTVADARRCREQSVPELSEQPDSGETLCERETT